MKKTIFITTLLLFSHLLCLSQTVNVPNSCLGTLCRLSVNLTTHHNENGYYALEIPTPPEGFSSSLSIQGPGQPKLFTDTGKYYLCIRRMIELDINLSDNDTKVATFEVFVNKWYDRFGHYTSSGCNSTCECVAGGICNPNNYCSCSGASPCYYLIILDVTK